MATECFGNTVTLARQQALPALKARAEREGLIITICSWCNAYVGEQDGRGVTGISHGICATCEAAVKARLDELDDTAHELGACGGDCPECQRERRDAREERESNDALLNGTDDEDWLRNDPDAQEIARRRNGAIT